MLGIFSLRENLSIISKFDCLKFGRSSFGKTTDNFYSCRILEANWTFLEFWPHFPVYNRLWCRRFSVIQLSLRHDESFHSWLCLRTTAEVVNNVQRCRAWSSVPSSSSRWVCTRPATPLPTRTHTPAVTPTPTLAMATQPRMRVSHDSRPKKEKGPCGDRGPPGSCF